MKRLRNAVLLAPIICVTSSCIHVSTDPIEVKPITVNVNIRQVDQQLDQFFAYENNPATTQRTANNASQPAPAAQ